MHIRDDFQFEDLVTGLKLKVIKGLKLDRLHVEITRQTPIVKNRDFFFTRDGEFDGTGSAVEACSSEGEGE